VAGVFFEPLRAQRKESRGVTAAGFRTPCSTDSAGCLVDFTPFFLAFAIILRFCSRAGEAPAEPPGTRITVTSEGHLRLDTSVL
jgi:hypothetical protein